MFFLLQLNVNSFETTIILTVWSMIIFNYLILIIFTLKQTLIAYQQKRKYNLDILFL